MAFVACSYQQLLRESHWQLLAQKYCLLYYQNWSPPWTQKLARSRTMIERMFAKMVVIMLSWTLILLLFLILHLLVSCFLHFLLQTTSVTIIILVVYAFFNKHVAIRALATTTVFEMDLISSWNVLVSWHCLLSSSFLSSSFSPLAKAPQIRLSIIKSNFNATSRVTNHIMLAQTRIEIISLSLPWVWVGGRPGDRVCWTELSWADEWDCIWWIEI